MASSEAARFRRAAARAGRITRVMPDQVDEGGVMSPADRVSLCTALSRWSHELAGIPLPSYTRAEIPVARRRLREP